MIRFTQPSAIKQLAKIQRMIMRNNCYYNLMCIWRNIAVGAMIAVIVLIAVIIRLVYSNGE